MAVMVGLVTFALTYLQRWSSDPEPWQWIHAPTLVGMSVGVLVLVIAFIRMFSPDHQSMERYRSTLNFFMWGSIAVIAGVLFSFFT